jgi:hypothetical protein
MVLSPLFGFHTMAAPIRLNTESEKVQYFRNALLGDDLRYRIVVGGVGSGKKAAFLNAVEAIKAEGIPANQFIYGSKDKSLMFPLTNIRLSEDALWFFPRATLGASVAEILEEEGSENCEVVIFE